MKDTNPYGNMRIDQRICGAILVISFADVVVRATTDTEINNTKPNTSAFQFLTSARFSENRVASIMISLISCDGFDSIISKVCSSSG